MYWVLIRSSQACLCQHIDGLHVLTNSWRADTLQCNIGVCDTSIRADGASNLLACRRQKSRHL